MLATWRWFGPNDPVSLAHIREAGADGIVTALHDSPPGESWTMDDIAKRKDQIENSEHGGHPLHWAVVESVPIDRSVQTGARERDSHIDVFTETLRNLSTSGIQTVCYNFMPVLDWSRTDLDFMQPDGSSALRYRHSDVAVFDIHIMERAGAENDYDETTLRSASESFKKMSPADRDRLTETILSGLPGSDRSYSVAEFRTAIEEFRDIGEAELRGNLQYFHSRIVPVAEELGMRLAIHPDDPPFSILGMPRIVSTEADLQATFRANPANANGLTLCVGSLGSRPDNDLSSIFETNAERIHFVHLRNVRRQGEREFFESNHLDGDVDMHDVVSRLVAEEERRTRVGRADGVIPMRPDHGHRMLDDRMRKTNHGYPLIGRLRGLAELRGLELGIRRRA